MPYCRPRPTASSDPTHRRKAWLAPLLGLCTVAGCGDGSDNPFDSMGSGGGTDDSAPATTGSTGAEPEPEDPRLDIGMPPDMPQDDPECKAPAPANQDPDVTVPCADRAPPDSFDPVVQWTWEGGDAYGLPLVINLTDDNGNGELDVCDIPDIIVTSGAVIAHLVVLDGATGQEHFRIDTPVDGNTSPAVGDIDGDGLPEIVAASAGLGFGRAILAFEHDGTPKWTSSALFGTQQGSALGIANMDNEGTAEVYAGNLVVRGDTGEKLMAAPAQMGILVDALTAPVAADLDGDGDLEFVRGQDAYHHDGEVYYINPESGAGFPQIANLDDDDEPEILVMSSLGISVFEHDGTPKYENIRPTGDPNTGFTWFRPATVHDLDGDDVSEFAVSSASHYTAYEADGSVTWIADVVDPSGAAAGTAFDFLGDGEAEAMYADEYTLFAFNRTGVPVLSVPRSSGTLIEYPVVADVDNDGSSEILIVSSENFDGQKVTPTLQVVGDAEDRWIQSRRIWNQHTYHVTNVNEDGTIPDFEAPSWKLLNTYRTNAQIEGGSVCKPPIPPEG